jgi:hypothetical protein
MSSDRICADANRESIYLKRYVSITLCHERWVKFMQGELQWTALAYNSLSRTYNTKGPCYRGLEFDIICESMRNYQAESRFQ